MKYDYNSQRKKLILPEYGRNVVKLVEHAMAIENREERNKCAQAIIAIMTNLNPHYHENSDFKHKLWDHLAIIADFKLDVDYPFEIPTKEKLLEKPNRVPYPKNKIKIKHYGRTIELLITEAAKMDDPEKKILLINAIANHMKRMYITWNNDDIVGDEHIYKDLETLSDGRLKIDHTIKLADSRDLRTVKKKPNTPHHHHHYQKNYQQQKRQQ